jgi:GDP-L-fucose synthase
LITAFRDKNVLVTGGTGMIGRMLVQRLLAAKAHVKIAAMEKGQNAGIKYVVGDLTDYATCVEAVRGQDMVFHLAGTKAGVSMEKRPQSASFMVPQLVYNANMMEAARIQGVTRYLFTSSVGVYGHPGLLKEDNMWNGEPFKANWYQAHAKRMGELQAYAYYDEFKWDAVRIVRPANTYGPFDNFDPLNSMVVPTLIARAFKAKEEGQPLEVWGNGAIERDFVHAEDVADAMMLVMEDGFHNEPYNIGSGVGTSIGTLAETIAGFLGLEISFNPEMPQGTPSYVMDITRAKSIGYEPKVGLAQGIGATINWYEQNRHHLPVLYNPFRAGKLLCTST